MPHKIIAGKLKKKKNKWSGQEQRKVATAVQKNTLTKQRMSMLLTYFKTLADEILHRFFKQCKGSPVWPTL